MLQTVEKHVLNMDSDNILMHKVFDESFCSLHRLAYGCASIDGMQQYFNWNANNGNDGKMNLLHTTCVHTSCALDRTYTRRARPCCIGCAYTSNTRHYMFYVWYMPRCKWCCIHKHCRKNMHCYICCRRCSTFLFFTHDFFFFFYYYSSPYCDGTI